MPWDTIGTALGTAFGGPLGGALGGALGGFLSNNRQGQAANQAAGFRQNAIGNQLASLQGFQNSAQGFQQGQFDNNLGLQRGFLNSALGQVGDQGQAQQAMLGGLFNPYTQAGQAALGGMNQYAQGGLQAFQQQQAFSGGLGPEAQARAYAGIESSPAFQALARQGEDAILQNASATGGLRGGNTQGFLAQYRPGLLNQFAQQQFQNLGGLSALGAQNFSGLAGLGGSAAGQQAQGSLGASQYGLGLLGQLTGEAMGNVSGASNQFSNIAGNLMGNYSDNYATLLGQQGNVNASNALAQGAAQGDSWEGFGRLLGTGIQAGGQFMNRARTPGSGDIRAGRMNGWFGLGGVR